ncbi:MAG: hypothetical protein ACLFM1_05150 [Bacteroidales bacterium]
MIFDDIKIYLPKFLSEESDSELFQGLKDFPDNIDSRIYTNYLKQSKIIFQGDGLRDMLVFNLPDTKIKPAPAIVFSNTCDIDTSHKRNFPSQIVYAPIFNLNKYRDKLIKQSEKSEQQINSHIEAIKKQWITQVFFLPKLQGIIEDSIVFLDRVCNCPNDFIKRKNIDKHKLFILCDYGAYLFLLKLSIHFTRIQDKVERKSVRLS